MLVNKLFTRKGWRVVAYSLLAGAGIGLIYILSKMIIGDIPQQDTLRLSLLSTGIALSLGLVALGSMLIKAELKGWR